MGSVDSLDKAKKQVGNVYMVGESFYVYGNDKKWEELASC
jgi:hypothetical protein